ncbi:hypothetical protein ACFX5K_06060, partial [Rickettsiales bacterium LUAb2]
NVNYIDIIVKNDFDLLFNETVNTLYKLKETMSLLGFKYIEEDNAWGIGKMTIEEYEKWKQRNNSKGTKRACGDDTTINQEASPSNSQNNIVKLLYHFHQTKMLFNKLVELGTLEEKTVINKDNKQINLYFYYDALTTYKSLDFLRQRGIISLIKLLGFEQDPTQKNIYTIPYNINLKDYKKFYLPFVVATIIDNENYCPKVFELTEIYKSSTISNNLDEMKSKFYSRCYYDIILKFKRTSGYVYKDTI